MKKEKNNNLAFKKYTVAKIQNMRAIMGGFGPLDNDDDDDGKTKPTQQGGPDN